MSNFDPSHEMPTAKPSKRRTDMRLFIGIPVPAETALALEARTPAGLRRTHPADMHITLVFLGGIAESKLPCIQEQLHGIDRAAFPVHLTGLGTFARAGVLFAEVEPSPGLLSLQRGVAGRMALCGFTPELRPYHPHITLSRDRTLARTPLEPQHLDLSFHAASVVLFQSHTTEVRPRYVPLENVALRTGKPPVDL